MIAYHELEPQALSAVLKDGLKRTSRGDKGDDKAIIRTDRLLDNKRPDSLKEAGWSRDNNLYAYLERDGSVIDITDGSLVPLGTLMSRSEDCILELQVDPTRTFVSDLDRYDVLLSAVQSDANDAELSRLANNPSQNH